WNTYMHAVLYINDSSKWPIQVLLRHIVIVASGVNADAGAVDVVPPAQSVTMAVITVATLPMLMVYPFIQRYFVKGALIGSVKGGQPAHAPARPADPSTRQIHTAENRSRMIMPLVPRRQFTTAPGAASAAALATTAGASAAPPDR